MFNELIVGAITPFSGTNDPDKNGENPVMIQCIAGKMPNRNVLSGTVAQRAGFEVGKTYLMQVREAGVDSVFGVDFNFVKIKELESGLDIAKTTRELGPAKILTVDRPANFEKVYERKTNAVESVRTERTRKGLYTPSVSSASKYGHETAPEVVEGTTITGANEMQRNLTPEDLEKAGGNKGKALA